MNKEGEDQKTQVKAQFNAIVADYDARPGCFRHFGLRLATAAGIEAGHKVLDVASGRGAVLFPVAARTSDVTGVDLAEDMVRATNEEAARQGLKAQVRVMDAEHLDFPDATFDHVLCGFGIMFFPDQDLALREFWRALNRAVNWASRPGESIKPAN